MCGCGRCKNCKERLRRKLNPERYRESDRRNYHKHKEAKLAQSKVWRKNNVERAYQISRKVLARVEQIKTDVPCQDCQQFFPPECMDFDHREPTIKRDNVSHLVVGRYSWDVIEAEISKCDVVCANCHRIRTKARAALKRKVS